MQNTFFLQLIYEQFNVLLKQGKTAIRHHSFMWRIKWVSALCLLGLQVSGLALALARPQTAK